MYLEQTEETPMTGRRVFSPRRLSLAIAIAAAIVLGSGASAILTQTIPAVGAGVAFIVNQTIPDVASAQTPIISACVAPKNLTATPGAVPAGSSGHIRFECGTEEAFHVDAGVTAFPEFNLTAGYTELWIFRHSTDLPTNCSGGDSAQQLVSGANITFASAGDYDYCGEYSVAPATGLEAFTISWTTVP